MTATPDGISFSDLQQHMDDARKREEDNSKVPTFDGKTPDEIADIVDAAADALMKECEDPMVHKAMIMELVERMIAWHTNSGIEEMEERNVKPAVFWTRDAGKFQAIANILCSISMGPGDYMMN
jgi:hypothetical protein